MHKRFIIAGFTTQKPTHIPDLLLAADFTVDVVLSMPTVLVMLVISDSLVVDGTMAILYKYITPLYISYLKCYKFNTS